MIKSKSVLIVEDELIQAYHLKKIMTHLGHNVVGSTKRGDAAIELAMAHKPEIILMDILLIDGHKGVKAAAQIIDKIDCLIIFITGLSINKIINEVSQVPTSTLISKPVTEEMFQEVFDRNF